MNQYLNLDCMDKERGLPSFPDNYFDLAILDPEYVIEIGERQNLKSRRTEILITNYPAVRHAKTYDPNRANAVQGNLFD